MRIKRIIAGILIGIVISLILEYINIFVDYLFPSVVVVLPVIIGFSIGAVIKGTKKVRSPENIQDIENLPSCVTEFISEVVKKMRYRQKVRLDVQAELEAHFVDELKDCKTDEEKLRKARQLLTEFGDVKTLAILLRRAKNRCRPLWRTMVARSFQALGVLVLCFIFYMLWFISGRPVITTDYLAEFNRIVRPAADESQNAAPLYNEAAKLYEEVSDDFILFFAENYEAAIDDRNPQKIKNLAKSIDGYFSKRDDSSFAGDIKTIRENVSDAVMYLSRKKFNELTVEQKNIIERWLEEQQDTLELIVKGSRKPHYWRTYTSAPENKNEMQSVLLPNLWLFRSIARTLRFRVMFLAEHGQYQDAFTDMLSCYRLGQNIRGAKTLIEQLVGIAIEALSVRTVRDILANYEIESDVLAEFQRDCEKIIADENYVINFEAERLCLYDEIQRCFTSDRFGKGHLYMPRIRQLSEVDIGYRIDDGFDEFLINTFMVFAQAPRLFGHPDRDETLAAANKIYDNMERLSRKSAAQLHAEEQAINDEIDKVINHNIFLSVVTPAVWRVIEISNRLPTEVGATLAMVAITRYKQDTGGYPEDLNELVTAGYISKLPIDSFSEKPLVYKRKGDDFILYSFGENCRDDGGIYSTNEHGRFLEWGGEGDRNFWPPREE